MVVWFSNAPWKTGTIYRIDINDSLLLEGYIKKPAKAGFNVYNTAFIRDIASRNSSSEAA